MPGGDQGIVRARQADMLARRMRRKWFADPTESVQKGGNGWSENADAFPLKHGESQDSPAQRVGTALPVVGR